MECQSIPAFWVRANSAFDASSVPCCKAIGLSLPGQAICRAISRAIRAFKIEVSTTAFRHSRVLSSITLNMCKRCPVWGGRKKIDRPPR
ncbi:MAG: hypothetical protein ACU0CI_04265, partial [Shimia sp.]